MPQHPAAPLDRAGLLDAFDHAVQAIIDLGWSCREDDFALESECPGWTVKDVVSHVVGLEKLFAVVQRVTAPVPGHDHVRNEFGRLVEVDVEARRRWTGRDVVQELADFHPERMAQLREADLHLETVVDGPFGAGTTFGSQLVRRVIDVWVHEQDIRSALDRPGDLDTGGAAVFTDAALRSLPRIAARTAGVEPGHAVVLDVTGPVVARDGVRVAVGADGRPFGEPLYSGHDRPAGDDQFDVTTIHLTTEALTRRAAGRRTTDAIHYTVTGDEATARRVLDALVITF